VSAVVQHDPVATEYQRRYWDALANEVKLMATRDGHVALDWSVIVLTTERA